MRIVRYPLPRYTIIAASTSLSIYRRSETLFGCDGHNEAKTDTLRGVSVTIAMFGV